VGQKKLPNKEGIKMREIKFRAWDRRRQKMVVPDAIWSSGNISLDTRFYGDVDLMQYTGLKDNTKWEQLTKSEQKDWLNSGKTKEEWNGKEIYEGDIVKECYFISHLIEAPIYDKEEVKQSDGTTLIIPKIKPMGISNKTTINLGKWETEEANEVFTVNSLMELYKRLFDIGDIVAEEDKDKLMDGQFFEIIGNIYENPELLEEK
jgi:uncharacterized phage protein (TIGR01671 family)